MGRYGGCHSAIRYYCVTSVLACLTLSQESVGGFYSINCRNVGGYPYSARGPVGTLHFYSYMVDLVCAALIEC